MSWARREKVVKYITWRKDHTPRVRAEKSAWVAKLAACRSLPSWQMSESIPLHKWKEKASMPLHSGAGHPDRLSGGLKFRCLTVASVDHRCIFGWCSLCFLNWFLWESSSICFPPVPAHSVTLHALELHICGIALHFFFCAFLLLGGERWVHADGV